LAAGCITNVLPRSGLRLVHTNNLPNFKEGNFPGPVVSCTGTLIC
jgi:hypothetical protein